MQLSRSEPSADALPGQVMSVQIAQPPLAGFVWTVLAGACGVALLSVALFGTDQRGLIGLAVGLTVYGAASWIAGAALIRTYPHAVLGLCNMVTLVRMVIVTALAGGLVVPQSSSWGLFAIAAFALALDGVDGWLARRQHLASSFGARFDMQVDAAFALVLALHAALGANANALVLLLGVPHYLFVAATLALPWLGRPLPERFSRKLVCVVQIALLIALQVPVLAPSLFGPLIIGVGGALVWSFGRDIIWLWQTRP